MTEPERRQKGDNIVRMEFDPPTQEPQCSECEELVCCSYTFGNSIGKLGGGTVSEISRNCSGNQIKIFTEEK